MTGTSGTPPAGDPVLLHRTFVCRARITPAGHRRLGEVLALTRQLYNAALEERIEAWRRQRRSITWQDQCKSLTVLRRDPLFADFRALDLRMQRAPLRRVDRAFRAFFRRCRAGEAPGFPRFKPASRWRTIDLDDVSPGMVRRRGRHTVLAVKGLPFMRLRSSRPLPASAMLKSVRVVRKPVRTEVHLAYALPAAVPASAADATPACPVGIDVGVARRLTLSTGEALARRTPDRRRLRRLQRRIARARRGSRGRRQAVRALGRAWQRLRDADRQALHRLAHTLCARFDGFAVEDLDVRNLTRSAKGTADAPGVRVAQKRGLNRAIADQGWSAFVTILKDQAASAGLPVIAVPAHGTSQTCSRCGANVPKALGVRRHRCPHCGLDLDRDHNAAICILRRAWPAHGRGLADVPPPVATAGPGASCAPGAGGTSVPSSGALAPLVA